MSTAAGTSAAACRRLRIAATAMSLLAALTPPESASVRASPEPTTEEETEATAHNHRQGDPDSNDGENGDGGGVADSEAVAGTGSDEAAAVAVEAADEAQGGGEGQEEREQERREQEQEQEQEEANQEKEEEKEREANKEREEEKDTAKIEGKTVSEASLEEQQKVQDLAETSLPALTPEEERQNEARRRRFKRERHQKRSSSRFGGGGGGGGARGEGGGTGGLLETDGGNGSTIAGGGGRSSSGGGGGGSGIGGGAAAAGAMSELRSTDVRGELEVQEQRAGTTEARQQREEECTATGPCVWCDKEDMHLEYCKETGRRQEVRCSAVAQEFGEEEQNMAGVSGGGIGVLPSSVRYRSCTYAEEDDFRGLFHFSMAMVALGVVACFGMRRRQEKTGSLYDRRAK